METTSELNIRINECISSSSSAQSPSNCGSPDRLLVQIFKKCVDSIQSPSNLLHQMNSVLALRLQVNLWQPVNKSLMQAVNRNQSCDYMGFTALALEVCVDCRFCFWPSLFYIVDETKSIPMICVCERGTFIAVNAFKGS